MDLATATLKTPAAAEQLNTSYTRLIGLIRYGKIAPPRKDTSGDYVWSEEDLKAARQALTQGRERVRR